MKNAVVLLLFVISGTKCSKVNYVDLGHEVNENSMRWLTEEPFRIEKTIKGYAAGGYWYESYSFFTPEHLSTHLDAPSHFGKDKWTVSDIKVEHFFGQGVVVDIRDKVEKDPNAELTVDDIMTWIDMHGSLPDRAIVFVLTGWSTKYGDKAAYFGTNDTNNPSFPGINPSAAQLLVEYENATGQRIFGVGIDSPSIDHGPSTTFKTHISLFSANIYGLENVVNLEMLPPRGFEVIVMPIKLTGGSGGPTRIVAKITNETCFAELSSQLFSPFVMILLVTYICLITVRQDYLI